MNTTLNIIAVLGSALMLFIGTWGLVTFSQSSTPELREMQMWISIALVSGGLSLASMSVAGIFSVISRSK